MTSIGVRFTSPLTVAFKWVGFLFWATAIGYAAQRIAGFTPSNWGMSLTLGALGLLLGHYLPHGIWDAWFLTTSWDYRVLPGLLVSTAIAFLYRGVRWWIEEGEERWRRAQEQAKREEGKLGSRLSEAAGSAGFSRLLVCSAGPGGAEPAKASGPSTMLTAMTSAPTPPPTDLSQLTPAELEHLQIDLEGRDYDRNPVAEKWWWGLIWATVAVCVVGGLMLQGRGCRAEPKDPQMGGRHYSVPVEE